MYDSLIDRLIDLAIEEDIATGDITTNAIIPVHAKAVAEMKAKADGVISGLEIAKQVFERFEKDIVWEPLVTDGTAVKKGDIILRIEASYRTLLCGERLSLNILQRMSGIATATSHYMKELAGTHTQLLDTRKTAPGLRVLDKMAVHHGGGSNHRMGLYDMIMLKDNHIGAAGSVTKAVQMAKEYAPFVRKIEVEVENLDMVKEAVEAGGDIIMLDNMSTEEMQEAIRIIDGRAETECSGNVTKENISRLTSLGVDYISSGALTHSAPILDISLKHLHAV